LSVRLSLIDCGLGRKRWKNLRGMVIVLIDNIQQFIKQDIITF
jgi:hypothetical protein